MSPPPPLKDNLSPAPTRDKSKSKYALKHKQQQQISQPSRPAVRPRPRTSQLPQQHQKQKEQADPARRRSRSRSRSRTQPAQARKAARQVSFAPIGSFFATFRPMMRIPPIFNILRNCVLLLVLIWTIVCLAIAVHFQGILLTSDLTRFIPFAIFVCSLTLLVDLVLLGFGLRNGWNPISVRIELGCLGLIGTLWLALGTFLGVSPSQDATVECFSSASDNDPIDFPGFNTDTYHAQYRVLEAFSLFNTVLIWAFMIFLLALSLREHFLFGRKEIWLRSVTAYSWFGDWKRPTPSRQSSSRSTARMLPPPVTAKVGRSKSREIKREDSTRDIYDEKRGRDTRRPSVGRHRSQSRDVERGLPIAGKFGSRTMAYAQEQAPPPPKRGASAQRNRSTSRDVPQKPAPAQVQRGASAQRQRSQSRDVERTRDGPSMSRQFSSSRPVGMEPRLGEKPKVSIQRRATDMVRTSTERPDVHRQNTTKSDGPDTRRGRSSSRQRPSGATSRDTSNYVTAASTPAAPSRRPSRTRAADEPRVAPPKPPLAHTKESHRGRPTTTTPRR